MKSSGRQQHSAFNLFSPLRVPKTRSTVHPRTTKRFPSPRCASAIQIVRPLELIAETQPQLQPALLRLSVALLIVVDRSRRRSATADSSCGEFARFKSATGRTRCGELCAHFLDLRGLPFYSRRETCYDAFQFLNFFVFFDELL